MPRFNDWSSKLATDRKSRLEAESPAISFQAAETARFLRSNKLEHISLILLDMMIPFQRPLSAFLSVAEPLSQLLFGEEKTRKILDFSRGDSSFEALREALERGEE